MNADVVGVVGAGTIGSGLAHALAATHHRVILVDVSAAQLRKAERSIARSTRLYGLVDKRSATEPDGTVGRICFTDDHRKLCDAQFVIENVPERWEIKSKLYPLLDEICPPNVPFGVNTSAIPITRIASLTKRPPQVIGMHYMNPVPLMPLVEVVRAFHTSDATVAAAKALVKRMGKECIVVADSPGFVTNRVAMLMINEAVWLVHENVASVEEIDRLFKTCFGHKMGPFETADLIGLDTVLYSIEVLHDNFKEAKYRPCALLARLVDAGCLGRKSGRGFYSYGAAI